jgi:hypothetical protein
VQFKVYGYQHFCPEIVRIELSERNAAKAKQKVNVKDLKADMKDARKCERGPKAVRRGVGTSSQHLVAQLKMENSSRPLVYLNM